MFVFAFVFPMRATYATTLVDARDPVLWLELTLRARRLRNTDPYHAIATTILYPPTSLGPARVYRISRMPSIGRSSHTQYRRPYERSLSFVIEDTWNMARTTVS